MECRQSKTPTEIWGQYVCYEDRRSAFIMSWRSAARSNCCTPSDVLRAPASPINQKKM